MTTDFGALLCDLEVLMANIAFLLKRYNNSDVLDQYRIQNQAAHAPICTLEWMNVDKQSQYFAASMKGLIILEASTSARSSCSPETIDFVTP